MSFADSNVLNVIFKRLILVSSAVVVNLLAKEQPRNKCQVPFARNSPFGCCAQKVPDTYFSSDTNQPPTQRFFQVEF